MEKRFELLLLFLAASCWLSGQSLVSVIPGQASQGQTLTVTVSGQNTHFNQGTSTVLYFTQGSSTVIYPNSVTPLSPTSIEAQFTFTYSHPTGYYQANAYNPYDGFLWLPNGFFLLPGTNPPVLTSVTPNIAYRGDVLTVTVSGQNTHFQQASITTWFQQGSSTIYPLNAPQILSNTLISAEYFVPYWASLGAYSTNVHTQQDGLLTLPNSFTVLPNLYTPAISHVDPDTVVAGLNSSFSIHGSHTHFLSAGYNSVTLFTGSVPVYQFYVSPAASDSLIHFSGNLSFLPAGWYRVELFNEFDGMLVLDNAFYFSQSPIGIPEPGLDYVSVYPNPFSGGLFLRLPPGLEIPHAVCYDIRGLPVREVRLREGIHTQRLDLDDLPAGVYYLLLQGRESKQALKVLKQ